VYTVTITVSDDDGGTAQKTFTVTVNNVNPILTGETNPPQRLEGQAFTLEDLGVGLSDPGFDNPLNVNDPANGGETAETFTGVDVDWGDGTAFTAVTVVNRVSGSPGVLTTARFQHAPHTYADDGDYTIAVRMFDDDGGTVTRTFVVHVANVAPTLTLTNQQFTINEGDVLTIPALGSFTDPGFDNPLNAGNAANGGETQELFTYTIDWGDGVVETLQAPATRTSGSPGVATTGTLADSHHYLDNDADNKYTITVTLSDDDGGSDVRSFEITVLNVNPTLDPIAALDVNTKGQTTLFLTFSDPGADSFEVLVDWGDKLSLPVDQRFVVETVHAGPTPMSFVLPHTYSGPPDPLHPADDIVIRVKIHDDDFATVGVVQPGESNLEIAVIDNPGIGKTVFRIDTTPQVPSIGFPARPVAETFVGGVRSLAESGRGGELRGSAGESMIATERFLELRIIRPDGTFGEGYRLKPQVLGNLRELFRDLPDNHYAIYLVQAETEVRRLVIEVFVRNGRLIDPGDDSEGGRDRPPTEESRETPPGAARLPDADESSSDSMEDRSSQLVPSTEDGEPQTAGVASRRSLTTAAFQRRAERAGAATFQPSVREAEVRSLAAGGYWRGRRPR
jgi:hypothetical protein